MRNAKELRDELVKVFIGVKDGTIEVGQGKTLVRSEEHTSELQSQP